MAGVTPYSQASSDLGLGNMLQDQTDDETEEEKRKKRLGLSATQSLAAQQLFGPGAGGAGGR